MLHNEIHIKFKAGKDWSSEFKVNIYLGKEEEIAPPLLNIVSEIAIRRSTVENRGNIFDKCSQIMVYADDVVIVGRRLQNFERVFIPLVENTHKMGLEINEKYTNFAIVSRKPDNKNEYKNLGYIILK